MLVPMMPGLVACAIGSGKQPCTDRERGVVEGDIFWCAIVGLQAVNGDRAGLHEGTQ